MALITPGMVRAIGERKQMCKHGLELTWLSESLNVKKGVMRKDSYLFFNYYKKIPTQYWLGKTRFLGNRLYAECAS